MKLLQVSDLHLSAKNDRSYCFGVLSGIIELAESKQCEKILFAGDVFDSYPDLESLRSEFISHCTKFSGTIYYLPGNHEILYRKSKNYSYTELDWSPKIKMLDSIPFSLENLGEVELVSIPHQENYADLLLNPPSPKTHLPRLGLAHGTVSGMSFTGLDEEEEEGGSYIDPKHIQSLQLDYLAVGHLHKKRESLIGNCNVQYAGSSRVWRRGELGPRYAIYIEVNGKNIKTEPLPIVQAGQYHQLAITLGIDGKPTEPIDLELEKYSPYDWVSIRFEGYVESMEEKRKLISQVTSVWGKKFRILDFDEDETGIRVIENLGDNEFIKQFLDKMNQKQSEMDPSIWKLTRNLGLQMIVEANKKR
ncbi:metallophosphoesterase [Leptospira sp. 96542]|nr:metallophosphoesterase [Leptospira sp. 96542]